MRWGDKQKAFYQGGLGRCVGNVPHTVGSLQSRTLKTDVVLLCDPHPCEEGRGERKLDRDLQNSSEEGWLSGGALARRQGPGFLLSTTHQTEPLIHGRPVGGAVASTFLAAVAGRLSQSRRWPGGVPPLVC